MREKPRYLRTAFLVGIAFMFITPIFSMVIMNAKADVLPELLTGIVQFPQSQVQGFEYKQANHVWQGSGIDPANIAKYDYVYGDVSNGNWNTGDWRFVVAKDFSNTDYYATSLPIGSVRQGSYWNYYETDHIISYANCTLTGAFVFMFGKQKDTTNSMELNSGIFSVLPSYTDWGSASDNHWLYNTTGYVDPWTNNPYYNGAVHTPAYAWDNSNRNHTYPWINMTVYRDPGSIGMFNEATFLAAGGTDYGTNQEPWAILSDLPDYTGLLHVWDITALVTLQELTSTSFAVLFSQGEYSTGRYIDYLGIWYSFTENTVYDYWIALGGQDLVIYGFIWLVMIFLPAMLLSQYVPKFGFIGGVTLMLVVMMISQSGFLPVLLVGMTNMAVIAFRGD